MIPETVSSCDMFVLVEDNLPNASLDDELGALIARKHGDIYGGAREGRCILCIEDRVGLCMHHIGVLCLELAPIRCYFCPWQAAIMAAPREAVVSDAKDDLIPSHNASPDLHAMNLAGQFGPQSFLMTGHLPCKWLYISSFA